MKQKSHISFYLIVLLTIVVLLVASGTAAIAATRTWVPTTGGVWSTPANWGGTAPVAGDDVIIPADQSGNITAVPIITLNSLTINGTCTFASSVNGNTITISTTFLVAASKIFTLSGVNIPNLTLAATATGTVNGTVTEGNAANIFTNNGTLIMAPAGVIGGTGIFINAAAATLQVGSTVGITVVGSNTGNIQVTTTRTYTAGAKYVYNGVAAQVTGNGLTQNTPANLTINNSTGVKLSAATTISGLLTMTSGTLDMGNTNLTVGSLTGTGNLTHSSGAAGARTLTVGSDNTSPAAYTGVISNGTATSVALTKNGTGTLILSGANTYTGLTTISAGTLKLNNAAALGTAAAGTTITSGAVLDLNGINYATAEALTINGTGIANGGAVINSSASGATYAGLITMGSASSIIGGTGTIAISNAGTITGATFGLTLGGAAGGTLTSILGTTTGTLTKADAGTWTLSGANTYTGLTTISAGTLKLNNAAALGTAAAGTTITSGAVLDLNGINYATAEALTINGTGIANSGAVINSSASGATYAGLITMGSASSIIGGTGTIAISNAGTITGATFGLTLGGAAGGTLTSILGTTTGTLTKADAGTWTLSGANTFTGGTTLNAGTLNINNANALGTVAGTFTINGGTINNTSGADIITVNYPLALNSNFTYSGSIPRNLNLGTGAVSLGANRQITVSAGTLTIGGIINDNTKDITKAGGATLSFGSNAVTLNNLTISAGTLISTSGMMNLAGNFSNSGAFTANSGTVNLNGSATQTIGGSTATSFSSLTINNSNGIVLGGNCTVAGTLTFTSGTVTTNAYSLAVSATGTVSQTSGYVIGNLTLYFAIGATSHTFYIGDASAYTPVTVSFASVTTAGSLTASTTTGDHPQILTSALNNSKTANRYWTLTNTGIVFTTYGVVFTFVPADLDASAVPASFSVGRYSGGTWTTPTIGTQTATTTQATGIAAFGDFQLGNIRVTGLSNYTITRQTGIAYNSISATGNSINSWRNSATYMLDDNRSNQIPIGFDFWYNGNRYTLLSVAINGFLDFSSSTADGTIGAGAGQDYDSDNPSHNRMTNTAGYKAWNVLAPIYGDMSTRNQTDPLGMSFKYLTTGTAPNRVLTVEWIQLSIWNLSNTGTSFNFQVKLYESTGVIEFVYGTMTNGTAAPLQYKCGFNGADLSGGLSAANCQIQQAPNTTNFLPQAMPPSGYTSTLPASNTKLVLTPNIPNSPTSLSISSITQSSMRLSWNDAADNEIGYVIYRSDNGGATYTFIRQLTAASTYSDESGLIANTIYYWKVYAVTEGGLSSALSGSSTTLPAVGFTSAQTGNWNTPGTWVQNAVPSLNSDVTIANGHTVTLDVNASLNSLTVGQSSSATLHIGSGAAACTLNVSGNITIQNGATLDVNTAFAQTGHAVILGGNLLNNGIFNLGPNASSAAGITFNKSSGLQTISGTGTVTNFYTLTVNVGTSSSDMLEVTSNYFSSLSAGFMTLTNGTFKLSTGATITPFSGSQTISASAGLWINNSSAVVSTTGGDLSVAGILRMTSGTLNIGNAADNRLVYSGGTIIIEGGGLNVAGRIERSNLTTIINFNMSGGVLTVPTVGSTSTIVSPIELTVVGSTFTWSNGSIIVQRDGGSGVEDLGYMNTLTNFTVSGGTLQIGNPSTPAAQIMNITSSPSINNILVNSASATAILNGTITILGNMTVTSGALQTALNGLVNFNGTVPQNISASSPIVFNNVTLNNSAGLSISNPITITCTLTLTNGALSLGANTLTFQTSDNPIVRTSGTISTTASSNLVFGTSGNIGGAAFTIPSGTFTNPPTINNLTINRTNNLTLNDQMMSLSGIMLCNGPLATNGNLTLLSTAAQTALIDGSGSGQVSGNVIMQRFLPSGFGYKYVSSPFQASTVNEFSNDLNLTASFPTFYNYDENRNSAGWVSYITTTNPLIPMQGYAAEFGSLAPAKTVDVAGVVNNGNLSITLYNHNQPYTLGFNLVGNPYPSPINWNAASGWTKTNIDNALYYFQAGTTDQYTGTYSTYINGVSSDGLATNIIPSLQGFFIHVSNGTYPVTGTLGMTNSVRINDLTHALIKSTSTDTLPLLRLSAGFADNGTPSDPAVIYFDSSATQSFDNNLDALKLMNTDVLVPNLYTITPDAQRLSINGTRFPVDSIKRIPIGLKTAEDGWITFKASDIIQMPTGRYIYLVDSVAGFNKDLKINPQYRCFLKAGEYEKRFSLAFSLTVLKNIPKDFSLLQNYPNPFNPRTTIEYSIPQTSFVTITVYDILGKEVAKLVNEEKQSGSYDVQFDGSKLSSGVYFYRLHAGNYFKTKKLVMLK